MAKNKNQISKLALSRFTRSSVRCDYGCRWSVHSAGSIQHGALRTARRLLANLICVSCVWAINQRKQLSVALTLCSHKLIDWTALRVYAPQSRIFRGLQMVCEITLQIIDNNGGAHSSLLVMLLLDIEVLPFYRHFISKWSQVTCHALCIA